MAKECFLNPPTCPLCVTDCKINDNECQFKVGGQQFFGTGKLILGCHRAINKHTYQWRIFDTAGNFIVSMSFQRREDIFKHKIFLAKTITKIIKRKNTT